MLRTEDVRQIPSTNGSPSGPDRAVGVPDTLLGMLIAVLAAALYMHTLAPGLLWGDSAEFQFMASNLGHAHATGYPIYLLLGKLLTFLPIAGVAWRVSLLSALTMAASLGITYWTARKLRATRLAAATACIALGLAPTIWSQGTIAEVYAPSVLWASSVLLLVVLWALGRQSVHLGAACFLAVTSLGIHASVSILSFGLVAAALLTSRTRIKTWVVVGCGAGIGLIAWLGAFLWMDSCRGPYDIFHTVYGPALGAWGIDPDAIETAWGRFRFLYTAPQWRSAMFSDPLQQMPHNLVRYAKALTDDFSPLVVPVMAGGLFVLVKNRSRTAVMMIVFLAFHLIYVLNYTIRDIRAYYAAGYVGLAILLAIGMTHIPILLSRWTPQRRPLVERVTALAILVIALYPAAMRLPSAMEGAPAFADGLAPRPTDVVTRSTAIRDIIPCIERGAMLICDWDELYQCIYVAVIDAKRWDLDFTQARPYGIPVGDGRVYLSMIESIQLSRPIYSTTDLSDLEQIGFEAINVVAGEVPLYRVKPLKATHERGQSVDPGQDTE
jgi:hypothetical protein